MAITVNALPIGKPMYLDPPANTRMDQAWVMFFKQLELAVMGKDSSSVNADKVDDYDAAASPVNGSLVVAVEGTIVQVVHSATGATATGSTTVPLDNTIPQKTEGDEYMTLAITPTVATHKLVIEIVALLSSTAAGGNLIGALFQDDTANALAAQAESFAAANNIVIMKIKHEMEAGTTDETTFKFRAGADGAGTTRLNGVSGAQVFNGVAASFIRITEHVV